MKKVPLSGIRSLVSVSVEFEATTNWLWAMCSSSRRTASSSHSSLMWVRSTPSSIDCSFMAEKMASTQAAAVSRDSGTGVNRTTSLLSPIYTLNETDGSTSRNTSEIALMWIFSPMTTTSPLQKSSSVRNMSDSKTVHSCGLLLHMRKIHFLTAASKNSSCSGTSPATPWWKEYMYVQYASMYSMYG